MSPGRYPFLWAALFCGCGIAFGRCAAVPVRLGLFLIFLFYAACLIFRRRLFFLAAALFFFSLGSLRWACVRIVSAGDIARTANLNPGPVVALIGKVISEPRESGKGFLFILGVEKLESGFWSKECSGRVAVVSSFRQEPGARIRFYCRLKKLKNRQTSGPEIAAIPSSAISVVSPAPPVLHWANSLKKRVLTLLSAYLSVQAKGLLDAMLLGRQEGVPRPVYDAMIRTGTVHILVVSGFNVGIVSTSLLVVLKVLRLPLRLRMAASLPVVALYCFLSGASTPVLRATIVASVFLCGYALTREPDINNATGVAGMLILCLSPEQLFDIGFQLSFASVLAIVWLYHPLRKLCRLQSLRQAFLRVLLESGVVSFCAWCGTAGLIAFYFRFFSPVTVLANLFIVPLASLLTLTGFCALLAAWLCPALCPAFASCAEAMLKILLSVNTLMLRIPAASFNLGRP